MQDMLSFKAKAILEETRNFLNGIAKFIGKCMH